MNDSSSQSLDKPPKPDVPRTEEDRKLIYFKVSDAVTDIGLPISGEIDVLTNSPDLIYSVSDKNDSIILISKDLAENFYIVVVFSKKGSEKIIEFFTNDYPLADKWSNETKRKIVKSFVAEYVNQDRIDASTVDRLIMDGKINDSYAGWRLAIETLKKRVEDYSEGLVKEDNTSYDQYQEAQNQLEILRGFDNARLESWFSLCKKGDFPSVFVTPGLHESNFT